MKLINELITKDIPVIAAVSGGADSVAMLLALCELRDSMGLSLSACHVEHGIRGTRSIADQMFVESLCSLHGVPLFVRTVDAVGYASGEGLSLEEAARILRREAYVMAAEELFPGKRVRVALAHHAEDNAETVLLNLIRGAGIRGIRGMESESILAAGGPDTGEITIIRPLLNTSRAEIEEYLGEKGTDWCEDVTNSDEKYARNRIRKNVIPQLEQINPKAVEHINAAAADAMAFYRGEDDKIRRIYRESRTDGGLDIKRLGELSLESRRRVIECWLDENGGLKDITRRHYRAIEALFAGETGKGIDLPGRRRMRRDYDVLVLEKGGFEGGLPEIDEAGAETELAKPDIGESLYCDFSGLGIRMRAFAYDPEGGICKKSYAKWFDYDKIYSVVLRKRREGDFVAIGRDGSRKSLRRLMIDQKIPRAERDELPVIAQKNDNDVIWVIGVRESMTYHVTEKTETVLEISVEL